MNGADNTADRRGFYAFTIKGTGKTYPTFTETLEAVDKIKERLRSKRGEFLGQLSFEFDSRHRLHAHGTIRSGSIDRARIQLKGWHIDCQRLKSDIAQRKWTNYVKKDNLHLALCQQYDAELYYSRSNGFSEHIEKENCGK